MEIYQFIFLFFSVVIIGSSLLILFTNNVLYAAVGLMLSLLGIAAIFVFANADFVAVTQLMVYVGGVLTLMLFGIMLSKRADLDTSSKESSGNYILGVLTAAIVGGGLLFILSKLDWSQIGKQNVEISTGKSTIQIIGQQLLTNYMLPFEVVAVLLLVALVGAAFVSSKILKKQ